MKRVALAAILLFACTPGEHRIATAPPPRVILLGLDGADWQLLDKYCADGTMPNLAALVRAGDKRVLLTQHPPLSPLVWTTMMTGVSPLEHRILDFTRFNPVTRMREPITSDERAVPAIWSMASAKGKKVGVFGMWATDPPESVNGTIVSDRMIHAQCSGIADVWTRTDCETGVTLRTSKEWIAKNQPDLAIVYFEGTDIAGHLFAPSGGNPAYFNRVDNQIIGGYRDLAMRLGATLIIVSDHGFDWNTKRPAESSTAVATAAKWHRDEGIFLRWSPHRQLLPQLTSTTLRVDQLCPMLLDLLHLPHDIREYRRAWRKPSVAPAPSPARSEDVKKLTALGYIGSNEPAQGPGGTTRTSGSFNNEGVILREQHRDDEALAAFENALRVDPKSASAMWNLSDLLHHLNRDLPRADALLDAAIELDPNEPRWLLARGRYALERHDCNAARNDFTKAIPLQPDNALLYASLGAAEGCLGHEAAARDAFRHSIALDPNQPEIARLLR
ncbi:MAG TPA: alkaline phosphatase family protein [Thermoanaerobaculia bacterium]|nr:alkaline phosphatase family protein [Thermoanaerobaculia bacterium]